MNRIEPARAPWLVAAPTKKLFEALGEGQARIVGGAVRNALLDRPVKDVDVASALPPDAVMRRLKAAGIAVVPTGLAHGTVTALVDGTAYEVTTLRRDVETDGRHAIVAFTDDWRADANRRDFTINALYAAPDGEIFDYHEGIADLAAGRIRFIGDARARIREDYLRILRLFRFHAWYGKGDIDGEALQAVAAEKAGLAQLSGERVAQEFLRLLEAERLAPMLRAMAAAGILAELLPAEANIGRLERLADIDARSFFAVDPVLRLAALLPSDSTAAETVAARFKLSNKDRDRLDDLASAQEKIVPYLSVREMRKLLYHLGEARFKDRVFLRWAEDTKSAHAASWLALLAHAKSWPRPQFPLSGRDVMLAGVGEGPLVGRILREVEAWWIDSDFPDDEFSLAERLKAVVQAMA